MRTTTLRPPITLGEQDRHQLMVLATTGTGSEQALDNLFNEIERARVVPEDRLDPAIVRMGSRVSYRTESGETQEVTLVYPGQADISAGRISILTPVGTALIGLKSGQSITWTARDGQPHVLTVTAVFQPATATL
jgi:regulator of nucleoside diphosphate kinase